MLLTMIDVDASTLPACRLEAFLERYVATADDSTQQDRAPSIINPLEGCILEVVTANGRGYRRKEEPIVL